MAWKGYAPYKQKTIPTPDVQKNDSIGNIHVEKVSTSVEKGKDNNPVTGSRAARKQKPVTWS
jgi:hypothetical protein